MSQHAPRRSILCYDIADPKRLGRVHRFMRKYGMALQYSVFECWLTDAALLAVIAGVRERIDESEDDVRVYGVRSGVPIATLGRAIMPEGVIRLGSAMDFDDLEEPE